MQLSLQEAAEAIAFYKRVDVKSNTVETEIARIKLEIDPKLANMLENEKGKIGLNEILLYKNKPDKDSNRWTLGSFNDYTNRDRKT